MNPNHFAVEHFSAARIAETQELVREQRRARRAGSATASAHVRVARIKALLATLVLAIARPSQT